MASWSVVFAVYFLIFVPMIQSAKILGFPSYSGSQYIGMNRIGLELVSRGHQFTILVSSTQKVKATKGVNHAVYQVPYDNKFMERQFFASMVNQNFIADLFFSKNPNATFPVIERVFCESLVRDSKLLESLKQFDLLITDSTIICGNVLGDYLDIPRVEFCPWATRGSDFGSLFMTSYVPQMFSSLPGKMNFLQRVQNAVLYSSLRVVISPLILRPLQQLKVKYNIKPHTSILESHEKTQLVLFLGDFAVEYAYPVPPYYKMIGPVNIQPAQPLPPDLQQLVDSSGDDGVIIVSFGSNVASILDKEKVDIMAEAFGRLKQKVIWRLQGYIPFSLSPNIHVVTWLPQSDLLVQKTLQLFVSHVGLNSLYEAAYYGVPVVALPLFLDQFDNALLLEDKGFGLSLDFQKLTADQLYSTIQRVLEDPSFRENAQRISRLMQDRPRTPVQEAGDWIEYTLRHGSLAHLRPYSSQLPWYQYFLVDVAVFLVLVVLVVIMVIKYTVRLMCWMCCRRTRKQKTQ